MRGLGGEHVDRRVLEVACDVGADGVVRRLTRGPHRPEHRGLEPAEREGVPIGAIALELVEHRPGEPVPPRPALARQPLDGRPARIAQPEELGHLVEGLAGGVVQRGA
jgi:hypothetical protein